jgi:hypothetical protein
MSDASNEPQVTTAVLPFPCDTPARKLDMDMYTAIVGHVPVIDPSLAHKEAADAPKPVAELARSWSPVNFCLELRRACVDNIMRHAQRQQVTDFIRRVGQSATRQIAGSQQYPKFVRSREMTSNQRERAA